MELLRSTLNDPHRLATMDQWNGAAPVVLRTWRVPTLDGGNGRDDGSAPNARIGVISVDGEVGCCRPNGCHSRRTTLTDRGDRECRADRPRHDRRLEAIAVPCIPAHVTLVPRQNSLSNVPAISARSVQRLPP